MMVIKLRVLTTFHLIVQRSSRLVNNTADTEDIAESEMNRLGLLFGWLNLSTNPFRPFDGAVRNFIPSFGISSPQPYLFVPIFVSQLSLVFEGVIAHESGIQHFPTAQALLR